MLPSDARVPSVSSRSRSSRRLLRFIRSVRSSSSSTKPVMPPSRPADRRHPHPQQLLAAQRWWPRATRWRTRRAMRSRRGRAAPGRRCRRPSGPARRPRRRRAATVRRRCRAGSALDVADDDRDGQLGHQRGQPVALLLHVACAALDLRGDLPFGDPAPLGQVVHRGGQLRQLGGPDRSSRWSGLASSDQPGLGGRAAARPRCSARPDAATQRDESGDDQRTADSSAATWPATASITASR